MWKDFFLYSRSEQRGIIILFILILLVLILRFTMPYWAPYFISKEINNEFVDKVNAVNEKILKERSSEVDTLFYFDPNHVKTEELKMLGFSSYQIKSIIGYREKVGKFSKKEDLLKIYGMDSVFYQNIKPYISIPPPKVVLSKENEDLSIEWINFNKVDEKFLQDFISSNDVREEVKDILKSQYIKKSLPINKVKEFTDEKLLTWLKKNSSKKWRKEEPKDIRAVLVDLNSADTTELKKLKGIGSKLSARIIKYRDLLGGFYNKSQLIDVYGISEELYKSLSGNLWIDTTLIKKINPKKERLKEICRHPYISNEQARDLLNLYRKKEKPYCKDILGLKSVDIDSWDRIKHYLFYYKS